MIKKKVLLQGSLQSLREFVDSKFNVEFEPLAIVSDELEKIALSKKSTGGGTQPEIFTLENLPRTLLRFIDGIVLTERKSRQETINRLLELGLEPRKIILWNNRGEIEFFDMQAKDGSPLVFMEGLQFHIRNKEDLKFFQEMHSVLQNQRQMYSIDPAYYPVFVALQYQRIIGKPLDYNNLKTWTEKMQWIKLYDSTPIKTRLADKYLVRQWVAEKIGQEYLIPLYGVWDNFDEIDFELLPNQFVLKCNHGSAMNIICRDKNNFDIEGARQKLTGWLAVDYGMRLFEPHYCNIKRKIIAEKFMTDGKNFDLIDYKFVCFDGKPYFCQYLTNRSLDLRLDYFDMHWNHLEHERRDHIRSDHPEKILKPKNFEFMKKFAAQLCKDLAHVRVDFYEVEGKVYFGEMTFTPAGGNILFKSKGTDEYFGSLMTLPYSRSTMAYANPEDFEFKYSVRQKMLPVKNILPRKTQPLAGRIIASLTSWTKRISTVHLAIQTILSQTRQPDLTVLYLSDSEFPNHEEDLPNELTALLSEKFEIRYTKDYKVFTKLIPALKDFPDDAIVTFDDDIFYDRRLVEILWDEYLRNPQYIHCHRVTDISFNEAGEIGISHIPYNYPTYLHKLTGVGSVLYPPHCLHEEVFNEEKFKKLSPFQDDIWFWLMGAMNGYKVNVVKNNLDELNYIPNTQEVGLCHKNDEGEKLFFVQLKNILDEYPILKDILESEWRRVIKGAN